VKTIKAEYSKRGIKFGSVKIISDIKPDEIPDDITHEYIERCLILMSGTIKYFSIW
jgi:hypothetical protein